jgi:hypothetical protein
MDFRFEKVPIRFFEPIQKYLNNFYSIMVYNLPKDIWSIIVNDLHKTDINNLYRTSKIFKENVEWWRNSFYICNCKLLPLQKWNINKAAQNGYLEIVQWLHENRDEGCTTDAMNMVVQNGHLHVVEWLHENRDEGCTTDAMNIVVQNGHLHVVEWLHENQQEGCTSNAMNGLPVMDIYML